MLSEPHTDHNNNYNQRNNNGGDAYKQTRILQKNNGSQNSPTDETNNRNEGNRRANVNNGDGRSGSDPKGMNANRGGLKCERSVPKSGVQLSRAGDQQQQELVKLVLGSSGQKRQLGSQVRKWSAAAAAGSCRWNDKGGILLAVVVTSLLSFTTEVSCQGKQRILLASCFPCGYLSIPFHALCLFFIVACSHET